jgi:TRAP-type transport system small permease protein
LLNRWITTLTYVLSGGLMVFLLVITGWQVWGRYVLNDTPSWVEKSALLAILYIALPMAAVGVRERFHMNVVFLVERFSTRQQRTVGMLMDAALLVFGMAMAWYGVAIAKIVWPSKMPILPLSEGMTYVPLVIAGVMIVLFTAEQLLTALEGDSPDRSGAFEIN